jgi:hypothetical protein
MLYTSIQALAAFLPCQIFVEQIWQKTHSVVDAYYLTVTGMFSFWVMPKLLAPTTHKSLVL